MLPGYRRNILQHCERVLVAEMARQRQRSQERVFRTLAYQLGDADDPEFGLSGQPLDRVLRTALHPMIYDLLIDLAAPGWMYLRKRLANSLPAISRRIQMSRCELPQRRPAAGNC